MEETSIFQARWSVVPLYNRLMLPLTPRAGEVLFHDKSWSPLNNSFFRLESSSRYCEALKKNLIEKIGNNSKSILDRS